MRNWTEGRTYYDPETDSEFECVDLPDDAHTRNPDTLTIAFRDDAGEVYTFFADTVRHFERVPRDGDELSDDEKQELADRAREDWNRLAREFDTDVNTVRDAINDVKSV